MRIIINQNRKVNKINEYNTQNENKVTELTLELPKEYENWNKRIVFITDEGTFWDYIQDNTYLIKKNVTQYERVQFYIWLTNGEQDYRTETKDLFFNKNIEADDQIPTEEQIDGFNTLITTLNLEIEVVNNKETELNGIIADLQHKLDTDYFKGEKGDKGDTGEKGIQGERGEKGDQGIPGINGTDGQDGFSPIASVQQTSTGAIVTVTDRNGTTTAELRNGTDGTNGTNGQDGQDGYTPVRGTDYWTSEDIAQIEGHCDDYIDDIVEDLEERVEDLENNQLQGTASGTSIDLQDSADSRVKSIVINGNSMQNDNPTVENPQEIKSSGDNGYIVEKFVNKNLYLGNARQSSATRLGVVSFKIKPNTTYTLNSSNNSIQVINYYQDNNKDNIINTNWQTLPYTFTTPANCYYLAQLLRNSDNSNIALTDLTDYQIEEGSIATEYEPHQEQVFTIPCQQPMRAIGDVKDKFVKVNGVWYERHYIARIASYNGEEITTAYMSTTGELSTGATVDHVLNTPQDLPCTQAQITVLEALMKARTYKKITHIYSEDEVPAEVDLIYYKDTQTYLDNIITRLEVLESEV